MNFPTNIYDILIAVSCYNQQSDVMKKVDDMKNLCQLCGSFKNLATSSISVFSNIYKYLTSGEVDDF